LGICRLPQVSYPYITIKECPLHADEFSASSGPVMFLPLIPWAAFLPARDYKISETPLQSPTPHSVCPGPYSQAGSICY
jgi:hypothetical protein